MSDDTSGHDAFAAALSGNDAPQIEGTVEAEAVDLGQDAGAQPEPSPEPAPEPAPAAQRNEDGHIPSWRLREVQEERRQIAAEAAELRRWRAEREEQDRRREQEEALKTQDFYTAQDPNQFIDQRAQHVAREALTPIQQEIQQLRAERQQEREESSRERAEEKYGKDVVVAAWQRVHQAILSGDPEALALKASLEKSRHPYGDLVSFDKRRSTLEAIGGDLESYTKKQREEALKDPEFLARALEAHRSMATPVQTGVPGRGGTPQPQRTLPSLNRQTSSRDGSGEGGVGDVFAQTIAERGRRTG